MADARPTSATIDFDDFMLANGRPAQGLPRHFEGLSWKGFNVYNSKYGPFGGSGYEYGCTSGTQAAVSNGDQNASVFLRHGSFTLESLNMAAGWDRKLTVDIYGYRDGEEVYHRTVRLTDTAPAFVRLHFENVDKVTFDPGKGVPDDLIGSGDNMIFDDLVFTNISHVDQAAFVPQPMAAALHQVVELTALV